MRGETVIIAIPATAGVCQAEVQEAVAQHFEQRIGKAITELACEARGIEALVAEHRHVDAGAGFSDERVRVLLHHCRAAADAIIERVQHIHQLREGRDAVTLAGAQDLLIPQRPTLAKVS